MTTDRTVPGPQHRDPADGDLRALAERLAPGVWPTADIPALRDFAARCRALAARITDLTEATATAHRDRLTGSGRFVDAVAESAARLADHPATGLTPAARHVASLGTALDAYADASAAAVDDLTMIAAVADRDRLAGEVAASLGDDSARVMAASAGRMALTAAGDDYSGAAGDAGTAGGTGDDDRGSQGAPPPAATSAMMPMGGLGGAMGAMGAMGALGGVGVAAHLHRRGGGGTGDTELDRGDADWLELRARQLQASLPPPFDEWVRTAVGVGSGPDGARIVVIATSDPQPYQRPGLDIRPGEILAANGRPPEVAVLESVTQRGGTILGVAAALPAPAEARAALVSSGVPMLGPQPA